MASKHKAMKWIGVYLAFLLLSAGCAHEMRRFPAPEGPARPPARLAPYDLERPEGLEQRIRDIQVMLQSNRLSPEDRLLAQDLLKIYRAYDQKAALSPMDKELEDFIRLLVMKLMHLDERYFKSVSPEERETAQVMALFSGKRKKILDSYLSGDYQGVVDGAIELEKTFGTDSLLPEIGLVFALSLARLGKVEEALRVGTRISDELERSPGLMELRAKMVEWKLALGDGKGAERSYEKLVDTMHESEAVVKSAEQRLSAGPGRRAFHEKKEEPPSPSSPPSPIDLTKEPPSLQDVFRQVDGLVQENEFDAAKLLLLRLAIRLQSGPEADLVDQAMKSVELAEEKFQEQERSAAFQKQEVLELALGLVEQEKYEEAIAQIQGVAWGKELGPEARQLQDLAVERIVNRQRNEAAKLFLMARNTRDPAQKENFLLASYNILKALVEKYPLTPLYQTINDNMKRIEEELAKVRKSS